MTYRVRWHGLEFVGDGGDATFTIGDNGLSGVFDGVDSRGERVSRPTADGEFDAPGFLTGVLGSISGNIHAKSPGEYEYALRRLTSIPVRDLGRMVADSSEWGKVWLDARRFGKPDVKHLVWGRLARFQVQFLAPDPRKYGEIRSFAGASVQAFHYGNYPAAPVVDVVGPVSAPYTVASQGHSVTVTQSLTSGQTHRINMGTGWVYRNGVLQTGAVSVANVFTIPPGPGVAVTGPASMTVNVTDTYG